MAQLRGLGQPFGSPGGIINIPAPSGSALAGQIQMRAMEGLGRGLGTYMGQRRANQDRQENLRRIQAMGPQQDIFNTMYGARGMQAPQAQVPQMVGPEGQRAQLGMELGRLYGDPLETEYKRERIEATKALTKQREEATKQALPDRMLRQADRWLRIVDDVMSEYWYTPEGPYKDKLLRDAQSAREKAVKLIEKYGATSEAGKASIQQLESLDEEIKKAGGKVKPVQPTPKAVAPPNRLRDIISKYGKPKTKKGFDSTLSHITSEEGKDIYFEMYWRPEFGR